MNNYLEHTVSKTTIDFFTEQARQKIENEKWLGRNKEVKIQNFVHCWITEEAFKQLLMQKKITLRNRGLYFGDAAGAGEDFVIKQGEKEVSIGLRSVAPDSLNKYKSVAYPDDRFRTEQHKIADFIVVCHNSNGCVKFYGAINKSTLLSELEKSRKLYSKMNQEYFRVVPLELFSFRTLQQLFITTE
ncbi:hypothetical protein HOI26_05555 [Candidatus Woesearchaeota archaeon]|jgi:hypothetical protein|nr:hypothetical protein [Candidatus Woesearchaeota archaeon]MBT5740533.1 hypothetical protein [Candidatus Woesearchaeota archaeon]